MRSQGDVQFSQQFTRAAGPTASRKNICERLPTAVQDQVKMLYPAADDHIDVKRCCYQQVKDVIDEFYAVNGAAASHAPCMMHHCERCDLRSTRSWLPGLCVVDDEEETNVDPFELDFHAAGTTLGLGTLGLCVWQAEQKHKLLKEGRAAVMSECTEDSSAEFFAQDLPDEIETHSMLLCPTFVGEPVERLRRVTLHLASLKWFLAGQLEDFMTVCGRTVAMNGNEAWRLGGTKWEEVEMSLKAESRVLPVDLDPITHYDLLLEAQKERLATYESYGEQFKEMGKVSREASMVYDLDQNPATQPRMFGLEPDGVDCLKTFVGHGTWWNTRFARPLLCSEQLQEHGFPVEDELLEQLQLRMPLDCYF